MSNKKILHLIPEEKITSQIIENFKLPNTESSFLFFKENVFYFEREDKKIPISEIDINVIVQKYSIEAIVIHGLYPSFAKLICELNSNIKIAWFVWGFDIYNRPKVTKLLYAPKTRKVVFNLLDIKSKIRSLNWLRKSYHLISRKEDNESNIEQAYRKINYFCSYIYEDYQFFDRHYKHNAEFVYTPFCTTNQYLGGNENLRIKEIATDIIVGNSNSPENNHLDVFSILKCSTEKEIKIIVPLSYGNNLRYRATVLEQGNNILPDSFVPLLDFMDRDKYLDILTGCSTAIFLHQRQQAMGNIIAMLYMGTRIYLSDKNPVYDYCKRIGLNVFNFNSEFCQFGNQRLEIDLANENRQILETLFSKNAIEKSLMELVGKL